ncbi:MAG: HD domain-containing phosphohydrolase [Candidatus Omnitrophota bacterium]
MPLCLLRDVYTVYGDLLVKKETAITPSVIAKIRSMSNKHKQVRVPLKNTDIFTDFEKIFDDERYSTMLASPVSKAQICKIAGRLRIENDLIFELNNMKRNLPYTYRHVLVVAAFVIKLSRTYRPRIFDEEIISHCGFTHDIGKTRVPISILNKKEALTREERAVIETHPTMGYLLLNYYLKKDRVECALASLDHHERMDGSGYPCGIKRLSKYTQLISPVDVMDALMTSRPYRNKVFSLRATLDYLLREAVMKRLNKDVILTLISYARKDKPDIKKMKISAETRERLPEAMTHDKYQ